MTDDLDASIIAARKKLTGYSESEQAVIELINFLIRRYNVSLYDLEAFDQHECERCDH